MTDSISESKNEHRHLSKLWLSGNGYSTCLIPKTLANEYGLSEPCYITIEKAENGILIKRLNIRGEEN